MHWMTQGWWMWIWWLVLPVVLLLVVWFVARQARPPSGTEPSAEEILRRRYAAGEIDEQEFLSRLDLLRRRSATTGSAVGNDDPWQRAREGWGQNSDRDHPDARRSS